MVNLSVSNRFLTTRLFHIFLTWLRCYISTILGTNSLNGADVPLSNKQLTFYWPIDFTQTDVEICWVCNIRAHVRKTLDIKGRNTSLRSWLFHYTSITQWSCTSSEIWTQCFYLVDDRRCSWWCHDTVNASGSSRRSHQTGCCRKRSWTDRSVIWSWADSCIAGTGQ